MNETQDGRFTTYIPASTSAAHEIRRRQRLTQERHGEQGRQRHLREQTDRGDRRRQMPERVGEPEVGPELRDEAEADERAQVLVVNPPRGASRTAQTTSSVTTLPAMAIVLKVSVSISSRTCSVVRR